MAYMENNQDDVRPWDLLNPNKERSSEELAEYRLEICRACPMYRPKSNTCKMWMFYEIKDSIGTC